MLFVLTSVLAWPSSWIYAMRPHHLRHLVLSGRTRALQSRRTLIPRGHASETDGWSPAILASAMHQSVQQSSAATWRVQTEITRRLSCATCANSHSLHLSLRVCVVSACPSVRLCFYSHARHATAQDVNSHTTCKNTPTLEFATRNIAQRLVQLCPQPRN